MREQYFTEATEIHHLRPVAQFPALALDIDNLESLCWDCHEATKPRSQAVGKSIKGVRIIRITDGSEDDSETSSGNMVDQNKARLIQ